MRPATAADAAALARLRYEFRSTLGEVAEDEAPFVARCRRWMRSRLGERNRWRCWVAIDGTTLVGMAWVHRIEKVPNPVIEPEAHAYVTSVYVREALRGRGLGSELLAAAIDWCRERDVHAVILWPTARSRALYERFGFRAIGDVMDLPLADVELEPKRRR